MDVIKRLSPNCKPRSVPIKYVILHGTWMDNDDEALNRLCDPVAEVSCHYLISREGDIYQLVEENHVAWHAGVSAWGQDEGLNANSIGIELSHPLPSTMENPHYTEIQYQRLEQLLLEILSRHQIFPKNILAHSDIATDRKDDPGAFFNWQRLYDTGLAEAVCGEPNPSPEVLRHIGYHGSDEDVMKAYALRLAK